MAHHRPAIGLGKTLKRSPSLSTTSSFSKNVLVLCPRSACVRTGLWTQTSDEQNPLAADRFA